MSDEIPSDTSRVTSTAHGRMCNTHKQPLEWVNGKWKCLECTNTRPDDWKHPQSGGLTVKGGLGEKDKIEIVKNEFSHARVEDSIPVPPTVQSSVEGLVFIPQQALELFKSLTLTSLSVRLTREQILELKDKLENMPTPLKMTDTKEIIKLIERLEELLK